MKTPGSVNWHEPHRVEARVSRSSSQKDSIWVRDTDLTQKIKEDWKRRSSWWSTIALAYGSLGVIYGDIGTSVLYVFPAIFASTGNTDDIWELQEDDVLGAISLIFWTLTLIALVKYVGIVLKANDTGEGGTVALYALLCRTMGISPFGTMRAPDHKQVLSMTSAAPLKFANLAEQRLQRQNSERLSNDVEKADLRPSPTQLSLFRARKWPLGIAVLHRRNIIVKFRRHLSLQRTLLFLALLATGLVMGDGVLMPAFSVVSAISGLHRHTDGAITDGAVVGISVAIIVVLFCTQHFGTRKIAFLFSPIIIVWLLANFCIAVYNLSTYGGVVFKGLSPHYIVIFFNNHRRVAWEMLGGVMLCITGTETMFAAMGHFSRNSVAISFGLFAYPCLMFSYLGQGAYLLQNPQDVDNTFWSSVPSHFFWPMLVIATSAAVVASQAVITGTFSIIRQATSLGVFPKLQVIHTSRNVEGQIFIPVVNYTLMCLCVAVIAGFDGDSIKLGNAYGVAVMLVMLITTCLVTLIMVVVWEVSLLLWLPFFLFFVFIEGAFLSANLFKVPYGGWFTLAVAFGVACVMLVWWSGTLARRRVLLANSKFTARDIFTLNRGTPREAAIRPADVHPELPLSPLGLTAAGYATYADSSTHGSRYPSFNLSTHGGHLAITNGLVAAGHNPMAGSPMGAALLTSLSSGPAGPPSPRKPLGTSLLQHSTSNGSLHALVEELTPPTNKITTTITATEDGKDPLGSNLRAAGTNGATHQVHVDGCSGSSNGSSLQDLRTVPPAAAGALRARTLSQGGSLTGPRESALSLMSSPDKNLGRLGGLGIFYSESPTGIPPVMRHFLRNVDAIHEVVVFITVRFLPMPHIKNVERLLVRAVQGIPNFYQVVARYGYQDAVDHRRPFVSQIISTIMHKLELKAGLKYKGLEDDYIHEVEGDDVDEEDHQPSAPDKTPFGLEILPEVEEEEEEETPFSASDEPPVVSKFALAAAERIRLVALSTDAPPSAEDALAAATALIQAAKEGVVYYLGRTWTRPAPDRNILYKLMINNLFRTMEVLSYSDTDAWQIPLDNMVELGMAVNI